MELKVGYYVLALLIMSYAFYATVVTGLGGTTVVYIDLLLTIAVIHYVMSKIIKVKKKKAEI